MGEDDGYYARAEEGYTGKIRGEICEDEMR